MSSNVLKSADSDLHQLLFEKAPLPLLLVHGTSRRICMANEKASELFDTAPVPLFLNQLFGTAGHAQLAPLLEGKSERAVVSFLRKDETRTLEIFCSNLSVDGETYLQLQVVDITDCQSLRKKVQEERDEYKTYIEQSSEGIFCHTFTKPIPIDIGLSELVESLKRDGHLTKCNTAMARMYGYEKGSELEGMLTADMIDLNDPANIEYFKTFIENGFKIISAESHEKDRFGNPRFFLNNLTGIVEDGYLKQVWGTQRDITEKKIIENQNKVLANLVEQTSDVLTASDLQFRPITWNRAAENIYGLTADKVLGKNLREFLDISYPGTTVEAVREEISGKGEWRGEMLFTRPTDGKKITLLINFKMMHDEQGKPFNYLISGTNISDRKQSEERLKESENRFREMADSAPVGIWMADVAHNIVYINKNLIAIIGDTKKPFRNDLWLEKVHPDDFKKNIPQITECVASKKPFTLSYRVQVTGGNYIWVQDTGLPRYLSDGSFVGYIGSVVNINDVKLREQELRYQAMIMENSLDIIVTTDLNYKVRSWNKIAENYYGYTEPEAIGRSMGELVPFNYEGDQKSQMINILQQTGVWKGEISYDSKWGETIYLLHTVTLVHDAEGNKIGVMAVSRDITERKRAEAKLQQSELFYRHLIADSLDSILLLDADGTVTFASPSIRHVLQYEPPEVVGNNAFEYVHPEDREWAFVSLQREVEENPEIKFITVRLLKKDGTWVWCSVRGHNLLNNPHIGKVVIYFHDDSLRKKANDALKESEHRFRNMISDLVLGVLLQDHKKNILIYNKAILDILRISEHELTSEKLNDTMRSAIRENGKEFKKEQWPINQALKTRKPVHDVVVGIITKGSNEKTWVLVNCNPVLDEGGNVIHLISTVIDVTERKKLEQKLLQEKITQQKLLTQATIDGQEKERKEIGKELHDNIGQQLTTTKLYLDLARSSATGETMEMVTLALKSVSDVINEIRSISHSLVPQTLGDLGLVESIAELIDSIGVVQLMNIGFEHRNFVEDGIPENQKLMFYRIIQEQLNNVVKHANAGNVSISLQTKNDFITLVIKDDGDGFDLEQMRKGLGLTNIKNRAELFGGTVNIIAAPGKGCTLKVMVPKVVPYLRS